MLLECCCYVCCFFRQKTAYDMRISDWSSDLCSSDLTITILFTILIRRSRLGFHLSAIRENERAAAALGINVDGAKIIAAAISSGLAAPIGTFYAQYVLFIDPESLFGVGFSKIGREHV